MKLADKILESSNDNGQGEKKGFANMIIGKLKKESFSKDNESQGKMVAEMKKLAESDEKEANKFMKHMDEAASMYGESGSGIKKKEVEGDKK